MIKLGEQVYQRLLAQAEEAKERGWDQLAEGIYAGIGSHPSEEENEKYSAQQFQRDIYQDLWKMAAKTIKYHGVERVDAEKLDATIKYATQLILDQLEEGLDIL